MARKNSNRDRVRQFFKKNEGGWATTKDLAEYLGLTRTQVSNACGQLALKGELFKLSKVKGKTSAYTLNVLNLSTYPLKEIKIQPVKDSKKVVAEVVGISKGMNAIIEGASAVEAEYQTMRQGLKDIRAQIDALLGDTV
ncbi:MAG: hypothetical protein OEX12_08865 [Gammaproteobacteria bacterium]|nr:hypothetical protein [Gammaproteobacteria bacterium]